MSITRIHPDPDVQPGDVVAIQTGHDHPNEGLVGTVLLVCPWDLSIETVAPGHTQMVYVKLDCGQVGWAFAHELEVVYFDVS